MMNGASVFDRKAQEEMFLEQGYDSLKFIIDGYIVFETNSPKEFDRWLRDNEVEVEGVGALCLIH